MKIAKIATSFLPFMGGSEIVTHNMAVGLAGRGHRVTLYTPRQNVRALRPAGWEYTVRGLPPLFFRLAVNWPAVGCYLAREQRRHGYDLWMAYSSYPEGYVAARSLGGRVPLMLRCHGSDIQKVEEIGYGLRLDPRLEQRIARAVCRADLLVANSASTRQEYLELGAVAGRIREVPNGISTARFDEPFDSRQVRERLGVGDSEKLILTVGRNHPKKGFHHIPEITAHLAELRGDFKWLVVGRGCSELASTVGQGAAGRIIAREEVGMGKAGSGTGAMTDLPPSELIGLYRAADLFCLPARVETFGKVLIEAMAARTPVVTTDVPGCRDVVRHKVNGLLLPYGDWSGMAQAIHRLLTPDGSGVALAERARQQVEQRYDWDAVINGLEGCCHELCGTGPAGGGRDEQVG